MGKRTKKKKSKDKTLPRPPDPSAARSTLRAYREHQRYRKEVRVLQQSEDLIIPVSRFQKVVRDISADIVSENATTAKAVKSYFSDTTKTDESDQIRWTKDALLCLQEASEEFMSTLLGGGYLCTLHRGAITLTLKDLNLYIRCRYHPNGNINGQVKPY